METQLFKPVYHDRLLRLISIPLLGFMYRHIGEPSPLIHLLRDPIYYIDLFIAILSVWGIWELSKFIIRQLDRQYGWLSNFFQRLIIQVIILYGIDILITIFITFIYNDIVMKNRRDEMYDIAFSFVIDVPVALLMLTIIQLFYYALYLHEYYQHQLSASTSNIASAEPTTRKNVLAYFGKSLLPVSLEEIAYFHKVGEVTLVRVFENQDYRIDQTLEQLQASLPNRNFYRLNRQMIVSLQAVKEVKSHDSGKLLVILNPGYEAFVTVSRKKASEFKNWLNG
ncbi:MAG: LytTR family DNA-binding domain-containing protein [Saprospiraceae bacterium]|nr:LytTR family DNA-binding domain-containing protein [Saprospiraceae bacterium]